MTKIGGGVPKGVQLDPNSLEELEELKQQMATQAAAGIGPQVEGAPQPGGLRAPSGKGDRKGAQARLSQGAVRSETVQPTQAARGLSNDVELQQLTEQLQKMGYLPKPPAKVDQKMLEEAVKKAIGENIDNPNPDMDVEQLFAMIEAMLQKENGRRNGGGGARPGAPTQRPGSLPPASNYANRGPAPNQAALQQSAAQSVATAKPPPEPGSLQARVAEATQRYMGTSTAAGPDGGNLACAWSVNNILSNAGLQKVGSNPNYVPSVEQALQGGRGTAIEARDARPGDIVIWPNGHHIGIAMGNGQVANNSSSRASFSNMQSIPAGARVYRLNS